VVETRKPPDAFLAGRQASKQARCGQLCRRDAGEHPCDGQYRCWRSLRSQGSGVFEGGLLPLALGESFGLAWAGLDVQKAGFRKESSF
jgi:hypothetical protein